MPQALALHSTSITGKQAREKAKEGASGGAASGLRSKGGSCPRPGRNGSVLCLGRPREQLLVRVFSAAGAHPPGLGWAGAGFLALQGHVHLGWAGLGWSSGVCGSCCPEGSACDLLVMNSGHLLCRLLPYGPLAGGTLTDKYHFGNTPPDSARHQKFPGFQVQGLAGCRC